MAIRYLDGKPPEQKPMDRSSRPANGEPAGLAAANQLEPVLGFLQGAANKTRETTSQPILRALAKLGLPSAQKEMGEIDDFRKTHVPVAGEKAGETAADFAMLMAPTPLGKAGLVGRAVGSAVQGAVQHQAQNYAREGQVNPGEAAIETGLSAATMGAGSALGPALKRLGVSSLRRGLGISKTMMKGSNPPNLEAALLARKIPFTGGAERIAKERGNALSMADDARGDLLDKAGIDLNVEGANSDARLSIAQKVAEGSKGLTPADEAAASKWLEDYGEQALRSPGYIQGMVSGRQAIQIRKGADKNARFIAGVTPEGRNLASQEYRDAIENRATKAVEARNRPEITKAYEGIKREMRLDAPLLEAARERAVSTPRLGTNIDWMIGGAGGVAGLANPLALVPAALAIGGRRAINSTGGARAIYEGGRALDSRAARKTGKAALDLARATTYGILRDED